MDFSQKLFIQTGLTAERVSTWSFGQVSMNIHYTYMYVRAGENTARGNASLKADEVANTIKK